MILDISEGRFFRYVFINIKMRVYLMNVKVIAVDMDGTMLADNHLDMPEVNVEAMKKASDSGINIVVNTGRCYKIVDREIENISCVDYCILSNGASIIRTKDMQKIYSQPLSTEIALAIQKVFDKYNVVYEVYAHQGYISKYTYDHYFDTTGLPYEFLVDYRKRMIVSDNIEETIKSVCVEKMNADYIPEENLELIKQELNKIPGLVYSAGFKGNMEITAPGVSKGRALEWLVNEKLGLNAENVMAFGDSGNDVSMLQYAGESYALVSGNEKAKKAAKYITDLDSNSGGTGDMIIKYLNNNLD
jgi:hypothetical protein